MSLSSFSVRDAARLASAPETHVSSEGLPAAPRAHRVAFVPSRQAPGGGAAVEPVGRLGNNGNTVTPLRLKHLDKQAVSAGTERFFRDLRRVRFERRQQSRQWLMDATAELVHDPADVPLMAPTVAKCGWAAGTHVGVHAGNQAKFSGLQSCSSIWSCPCCASLIRHRRGQEVEHAADWWKTEHAGSFLFTTFTLRHKLGDSLKTSLSALTAAFTRLIRGAPWKRFAGRHGIAHMIKAVEVTLSWRNGWHAHLHVLFFTHETLSTTALAAARDWLTDRWADMVVKEGGRRPSKARGVDVRPVQDHQAVGLYITKLQEADTDFKNGKHSSRISSEMTRIDTKKGRLDSLVPFDLLDVDGLTEDEAERQRVHWLEYVETTRGRRAMTWSRGLKDACGLDDVADDEIVAEDEAETTANDDLVAMIERRHWRKIQALPDVLARILELVELDRVDEIAELVPIQVPIPK